MARYKQADLQRFLNHLVIVETVVDNESETVTGKVLRVGNDSILLSRRSVTEIILVTHITEIRIKRTRVVVRLLRELTKADDIRQHLADRHAVFISVLRMISPDTAMKMHDRIDHRDLGHKHGPGVGAVLPDAEDALQAMEDLGES